MKQPFNKSFLIDPLNTNNAIYHYSLSLNRAQKQNIKFIKNKVQPKVPQDKYLGHTTDETRTRPDTDKIEAIRQMPIPTNKQELQSFLGFLSYFAKFIANLSQIRVLVQSLLEKNSGILRIKHGILSIKRQRIKHYHCQSNFKKF